MKYMYTATFREKGGKVYARIPDLKGCITTGKNYEDAINQISDAASGWLVVAEDEGLDIPDATPQYKLITNEKLSYSHGWRKWLTGLESTALRCYRKG